MKKIPLGDNLFTCRPVDEEKRYFLNQIEKLLVKDSEVDITAINNDSSINFDFKNENYSIKIIRHKN